MLNYAQTVDCFGTVIGNRICSRENPRVVDLTCVNATIVKPWTRYYADGRHCVYIFACISYRFMHAPPAVIFLSFYAAARFCWLFLTSPLPVLLLRLLLLLLLSEYTLCIVWDRWRIQASGKRGGAIVSGYHYFCYHFCLRRKRICGTGSMFLGVPVIRSLSIRVHRHLFRVMWHFCT